MDDAPLASEQENDASQSQSTRDKGLHDSNPVQRAFRDLEAIQAHIVGGWDMPALNFGSVTLGGPTTDFFF